MAREWGLKVLSQNGVIWCILGVLFLRFMCHENDSDFRYSEVLLKGKSKTLVKILGVVNTGRPLHGKYWGVATPATPAALTPMRHSRLVR